MPNDASVTVEGVVTVALGSLEAGRAGFVQDASAGISVYLDAAIAEPIPPGRLVSVAGTIDDRFAQRTLRASLDRLRIVGTVELPTPIAMTTGAAGEAMEGSWVSVSGIVSSNPGDLADGLGVDIDDGSGSLRIVVGPDALPSTPIAIGMRLAVVGALGQRDSSGSGSAGYRVHATNPGDVTLVVDPSPEPTSGPSAEPSVGPSGPPSPAPSAGASPTTQPSTAPSTSPPSPPVSTPTPSPSPSASPQAAPISITAARRAGVGSVVRVVGVVTAERGQVGQPETIAIDDGGAGILVRLPAMSAPVARGTILDVSGVLAEPYGQREIRPRDGGLVDLGPGSIRAPIATSASALGEGLEGRLVSIEGRVTRSASKATSGDLSFEIRDATGLVRAMADTSSGVERASIRLGATLRIVGIVGQRASRKGRLDGYRVWVRDPGDVVAIAEPPHGSPGPGHPSAPPTVHNPIPIARAILAGGSATIEAVVLAGPSLLDASGRRIVVSDSSAGIEILVPKDAAAPPVGSSVRVSGDVGRAYGAPRMRADTIQRLGRRAIRPSDLSRPPGAAYEWRLVRVTGLIADLHKLGERWRAELRIGAGRTVVIDGLAGAGIPPSRVAEGRRVAITGIVRRPYPTAKDRRYAILPRGTEDVVVLGQAHSAGGPASGDGAHPWGGPASGSLAPNVPDVDLSALAEHVGERVRVGGLVVDVLTGGIVLDDGTAHGRVAFEADAAAYLTLLEPAEAINVIGVIRADRDGGYVVVVSDGADVARAGEPEAIEAETTNEPDAMASPVASSAMGTTSAPRRGLLGLNGDLAAPLTGIGSLVAVAAVSAGLALLRRRRANGRLAERVVARFARVTRPVDQAHARSGGKVAPPVGTVAPPVGTVAPPVGGASAGRE